MEDGRIVLLPSTQPGGHVVLRATIAMYAALVALPQPGAAKALRISVRNRLAASARPGLHEDG